MVGKEQGEECIGIGIYSHVEGYYLVEERGGMDYVVNQSEDEHSERAKKFASAVGVAFESFVGKETFEDVLTKC